MTTACGGSDAPDDVVAVDHADGTPGDILQFSEAGQPETSASDAPDDVVAVDHAYGIPGDIQFPDAGQPDTGTSDAPHDAGPSDASLDVSVDSSTR